MKRTTFRLPGLFLCLFALLTFVNSCEVDHFYKAEITVVDKDGNIQSGASVSTEVDVRAENVVERDAVTDAEGKVYFSFDNVAIMKVKAEKGNAEGENLLVLKEDKIVELTVIVYDN